MHNLTEKINEFKHYRFLLSELVKRGIVLKYRRSYLGLAWTLLEPLLNMLVLTFVFGTLFGRSDKTYPVYVLSGRLLYSCFSQATTAALRSIRTNSAMINKVYVPKYLYPLSSIIYSYVIFGFSLIVLAVVSVVLGVWPTKYILLIWIPLLLLFFLSLGMGMVLATLGVYFRDMEYLWSVGLALLMYLCAIFYYPDSFMNAGKGWVLESNPLFCIIALFRSCLYGTPMDMGYLAYAAIWCVISLAIGIGLFHKKQNTFVLHI